jgi:hypothetical protein
VKTSNDGDTRVTRFFRHLATLSALLTVVFTVFASHAQATNGTITLPDCLGRPITEPSDVVLSCADGGFEIQNIRWTGWGESFAAGIGTGRVNDCTPNCANGHFHDYPMLLAVTGKQRCPNGRPAYAKVTYAFVGRSPYPQEASSEATQDFPCKPRP